MSSKKSQDKQAPPTLAPSIKSLSHLSLIFPVDAVMPSPELSRYNANDFLVLRQSPPRSRSWKLRTPGTSYSIKAFLLHESVTSQDLDWISRRGPVNQVRGLRDDRVVDSFGGDHVLRPDLTEKPSRTMLRSTWYDGESQTTGNDPYRSFNPFPS
ncbi:hypothetical protein LshimejAT787_1000260 [Lyophyllum shimeji]|uniref:Uncharacterized protein n=1 Tax=Lyophyllum shimeji TaxID=47721 RepID=A0A9P3USQ0_LYOSH|nr:hypothetical protein LshimejAT787_1000260 [Lyophyllum shimeji]